MDYQNKASLIQRNDVVRLKATGELGRVVGAGGAHQILVRIQPHNLIKKFLENQLEVLSKGDSSI